jgi:hypothetical protein
MTKTELIGSSMTSTAPNLICVSETVHEFSPYNKTRILTFKRPLRWHVWALKNCLTLWLQVVHNLKLYRHTKVLGPTFTFPSFAFISRAWKFAVWSYGIKTWRRPTGHLQRHAEFHKVYWLLQSWEGHTHAQADRQTDWSFHKPNSSLQGT